MVTMYMSRLFPLAFLGAITSADLSASSKIGNRLLSKARRLGNGDDDYDFTWVTDYSIKFHSCHNTVSFRADAGREEDGGDEGNPTEMERLVLFKLCPTNSCGSCRGGAEYLIEMRDFVETYLESQMDQREYNCEKVQDNCDCDGADDGDACLTQCYADAGLDYCEDDDDVEVDQYLECGQVGNNDDYYNPVYVGAYCSSNGGSIYLGAFSDRQCTKKVSVSKYESLTGYTLPYTSKSLVGHDCISCKEPSEYDDDYNADQYDSDEVTEFCENLYEGSAKCERHLKIQYKTTSGCDYIHKILPRAESVANGSPSKGTVWAWIFAITTIIATGFAYSLYTKLHRKNGVDLSSQGGVSA